MTTGALLFAFDSEVKYTLLANECAKRIKRYLNIPVSLVTDIKLDTDLYDQQVIVEKPTNKNRHQSRIWYNGRRSHAFDYTPYQRTIILDTDYMLNGSNLLTCINSTQSFFAHKTVQPVFKNKHIEKFGIRDTHMWWATVVVFDKSTFSNDVFDCWKMVEQNYYHYASIFEFDPRQFRNDFALSIALLICNGTGTEQCDIPWPLFNVDPKIKVTYDGKWWLEHTTRRLCIEHNDLHIMGKEYLEKLYAV